MLPLKATPQPFLPMDKQAQGKPIPWLENKISLIAKSTKEMKGKVLFPGPFSNCGRKLNNRKINIALKRATLKSIMNRLEIY